MNYIIKSIGYTGAGQIRGDLTSMSELAVTILVNRKFQGAF